MTVDEKVAAFEAAVLLPALEEICASPRLSAEYEPEVVRARPHPDAATEELLTSLAQVMRRRTGPSLVLKDRKRPDGIAAIGGRYLMTVIYDVRGTEVFAAPAVMFWMRFNNKLHAFAHRYDNAVAQHRVEDVKRTHVLNHVLGSFDFYKLYAFSPAPFPGYGGR
ncbi:MAG: hypothetical protein AB1938_20065 [Myxococcota bacterium]